MPQSDLLSFHPTLLFLPALFLGGYAVFVTRWVPRVLLTLKARAWLTKYHKLAGALAVTPAEGWPELVLMFIQFAGLVFVLSKINLVTTEEEKLTPLAWTPPPALTYAAAGALPVENFFTLWNHHRDTLFFAPAAGHLTSQVDSVLGGFGFFAPGKQFPLLSLKLKKKLADRAVAGLSEPNRGGRGA